MSEMNIAGAEKKGLAPGAVERWNVRGEGHNAGLKSVEPVKVDRGREEHFACFDRFACGVRNRFAQRTWIADDADRNLGHGRIGNDVRRAATGNYANIES